MKQRVINAIKCMKFNFEDVMRRRSYYGVPCDVMPLFCSYGQIGWSVYIDGNEIEYDYELNKITVL